MRFQIRHLSGSKAGQEEILEGKVITIGRDPSSNLAFDPHQDDRVSTNHAQLLVQDNGQVLNRFLTEMQITAQLEHPNIIPVHDLGLLPNGEVYFTMKRIRGKTLKEVIRAIRKQDKSVKRAFPRVRLVEIFKSICQAVAFAHSRGVLHRDLKPSNVMVGDFGEVLVLDWGVAMVF